MPATLLTLLLSLLLMFSSAAPDAAPRPQMQPQQLWWGMLDPELSAWCARLPMDAEDNAHPVLWNWSWRGFLAALLEQPLLKEAADASHL